MPLNIENLELCLKSVVSNLKGANKAINRRNALFIYKGFK